MVAATFQAFQVVTQGTVEQVGVRLGGLAVLDVVLPVQEPGRNLKLHRVHQDEDDLVDFRAISLPGEFSSIHCHDFRGPVFLQN